LPQLAALLMLLSRVGALSFTLLPEQERCISETVPARSLLAGDWEVAAAANSVSQSVQIFSPNGNRAFINREASGHFAVTAQETGTHKVCIANNATEARAVQLNLKMALEVEHHDTVAKKEHVEAIEAELDRMKKIAVHVYDEMLYMRARADQQHATNSSTRGRLLWVEVMMLVSVILMGLWQIRYLRNYFKVKKLV